jgi:hypothetical protein
VEIGLVWALYKKMCKSFTIAADIIMPEDAIHIQQSSFI